MIIEITDDFDLTKIAESGQCFRWQRAESMEPDKRCYRIIHAKHCIYVEEIAENLYRMGCTEEEYGTLWKSYFDLEEDYHSIRSRIDSAADGFLAAAAEQERGIRILRQRPWEALVSFIISQNRNIPAICNSIEMLCRAAGEQREDARGQEYYTFPTPEAVLGLNEEALRACKLGYRWKYVRAAAETVAEERLELASLVELSHEESLKELMGLYGVGKKVASCVCLYGLHQLDAFPVDVWMNRILENEFADGYSFQRYSPYNGVYQQYMFAYYRSREQER